MIEFLKEVKTYRLNALKTFCCCLCLLVWGITLTMFGPAMLTLKEIFHTTLEELTMILPARSTGHVSGTIAAGYLLMSVDHQPVIIIAMFVLGMSFAFINWVKTLHSLMLIMFVNGLGSGFAMSGINTWILHMWGTNSTPFFQMINFGFSIGALIGPLLVAPFLNKSIQHSPLAVLDLTTDSLLSTPTGLESDQPHPFSIFVYISSGLTLLATFFLMAICVWKPTNPTHPSRLQETPTESSATQKSDDSTSPILRTDSQTSQWKRDWKLYRLVLIIFGCLYIHFAHCLEVIVAVFLPVFVVKCPLGLSSETASVMLSLYWICFTISRALAIGLSIGLRPKYMIALDLILVIIGNVLLFPLANDHEWALWLGTAILGFGIATLWPSLWGFLEELFPVSSQLTSLITLCACTGDFIVPFIVSKYIETFPDIYLYSLILYNFLTIFIFAICCLLANKLCKIKQSL